MILGIEWSELAVRWGVVFSIVTVRYIVFAGLAFLVVWVWKAKAWQHLRIQDKLPAARKLWNEFKWSLSTFVIFGLVGVGVFIAKKNGLTFLYTDIEEYGWTYFWLSIPAFIIIHDTYFYWTHRFMHLKPVFKHVHRVHHESTNPSPWAAFSFHPLEAVIEAGIGPLLMFIMPVHPLALMAFLLYMTGMNVLGHMGYEFYPRGFTMHWAGKWHNTSTHHNQHHEKVHCNYGLYFNYWDRIMGTNHKEYHQRFDAIKARTPAGKADAGGGHTEYPGTEIQQHPVS